MLQRVLSERKFNSWPSWHVIYEYEDIMSIYFDVPIVEINESIISKILNRTKYRNVKRYKYISGNYSIAICLSPQDGNRFKKYKIIPIFLDVYERDIDCVISTTRNLPIYWVTNKEIYKKIKEKEANSNVHYIPLSVSDKWRFKTNNQRDIDVVQVGRKNTKLHNYMMQYCQEHPSVNYVYQYTNGKELRYESTIFGDIGSCMSRDEYFDLLYRSRISLVSSPCVDHERNFGEGIDFITPRFYESAAAGCYMVGRYTKNSESDEVGIANVCDNITSYRQFCELIGKYLCSKSFLKIVEYRDFLELNYTSARLESMKEVLKRNNLL